MNLGLAVVVYTAGTWNFRCPEHLILMGFWFTEPNEPCMDLVGSHSSLIKLLELNYC